MAERFNLVDRTARKRVINRLMNHFGIRYTSHILSKLPTLGLQHFPKVNRAINVNGVPNNPDNPDGLPLKIFHFLPEQEVLEKEEIKIAEEVVVDEDIARDQRTKTETQKKRTTKRTHILILKTIFK